MNKFLGAVYPDFLIQSGDFAAWRFKQPTKDAVAEELIAFEHILDRYQISTVVLWDWLLALKFEPQTHNGTVYFTADNLERLERFIKRIEISWGCPHILEACCRSSTPASIEAKSSSSLIG